LPRKINTVECADCGQTCARVVVWSLINRCGSVGKPWWKATCNCGLVKNPITGAWVKNYSRFNQDVMGQLKAKKPRKTHCQKTTDPEKTRT
jgi:hypothetical protein